MFVLSILATHQAADPSLERIIKQISCLAIVFSICTFALLAVFFFMSSAPNWVVPGTFIMALISASFSSSAYRLKQGRR